MKKLTNNDLLSIWKSIDLFEAKGVDFTLFLKSSGDAGTLWYFDSNKPINIAEGDISIINIDNNTYYLMIGDKRLIIRPDMHDDFMPSFELEVPNFGFVLFVRIRS